ncbi:uncharacterized protein LOC126681498 [Mercurialis annua]|uniref:uncharacterized protein LOC126681498 n=1 Tax=Mercurialis annua TaxID=3986 RepID=UPI00215EFFAE|nr:uncharacterized protein LOC126681498 [Mercurialis annua]
MEYLTRDLKRINVDFKFHQGCKELKINNLMFADDLLLFFHGDEKSLNFLIDKLNEFKEISGLQVNALKSQIFFCNVEEIIKSRIIGKLGLKEGELPLRYLGIPLISSKLYKDDCRGIIMKITSRIHAWTSKLLSYAGRIQLIQSVRMSMHVFWASVMILPKQVTKEIQSICSKFLWTSNIEGKNKAFVSWKEMTKLKKEGGLSIKDISCWNRAASASTFGIFSTTKTLYGSSGLEPTR